MRETQSQSERRRGEEKEKEMREEVHSIPFSRRMPLPGKCGRGRILAGWAPSRAESGGLGEKAAALVAMQRAWLCALHLAWLCTIADLVIALVSSPAWAISLELVETSLIMQQSFSSSFSASRSGRPFASLWASAAFSTGIRGQCDDRAVRMYDDHEAQFRQLEASSSREEEQVDSIWYAREDILDAPYKFNTFRTAGPW